MENPVVSVCMITYNHEKFISEAIEGVLMQKTNFPIELIIGEDCSTDNTRKIVKEYEKKYPEIIVAQYPQTNLGMMKNFTSVLQSARGKYIALCEGDDYWTDPLKLQKQVDFLERNTDYGLVFAKVKVYKESTKSFVSEFGKKINSLKDLIYSNSIPTLTTCFRKNLLDLYMNDKSFYPNEWLIQDYPMWIYLFANSKVHFFDGIFGVYRELDNSASHSLNVDRRIQFIDSILNMQLYFCEMYKSNCSFKLIYDHYFATICNTLLKHGIYDNLILNKKLEIIKVKSLKVYLLKLFMSSDFGRKILKKYWKII